MEEDEVSMSSAAVWGRRVLLRVRMLGACYMGLLQGSLCGSRTLGSLGGFKGAPAVEEGPKRRRAGCPPPVFQLYIRNLTRA